MLACQHLYINSAHTIERDEGHTIPICATVTAAAQTQLSVCKHVLVLCVSKAHNQHAKQQAKHPPKHDYALVQRLLGQKAYKEQSHSHLITTIKSINPQRLQ